MTTATATALPGYSSCTIAQGVADGMADSVGRLISEELGIPVGSPIALVDPETGDPVGTDVTVCVWGETRTVPSTSPDGGVAYASDVVVSVDRDGRWATAVTRGEYVGVDGVDTEGFLAAALSEARSALDGA